MTTDSVPAHDESAQIEALTKEIPKLYLDRADDAFYIAEAVVGSEWLSSLLASARADSIGGDALNRTLDQVMQENAKLRTMIASARADGAREAAVVIRQEVSDLYASKKPSAEWGLTKLTLRQFGKWLDARIEGRAPLARAAAPLTERNNE